MQAKRGGIHSPARGAIRQPGFGGELNGRLNTLRTALETLPKGKTAAVDVQRCHQFLSLMTKASTAYSLSPKEKGRALELMRWFEKRRHGMDQSLGEISRAVQDVGQATRWLALYEGSATEDRAKERIDIGHKRASKQPGYVQPGRSEKVGVVVYLEPATHQMLKRVADARNLKPTALVKQLIEDSIRTFEASYLASTFAELTSTS
ncbi:hypothetical protein [Roseateles sp.]|uniref:hypothetical protein n=1 Tax=Roseateles sp. TaxID=1971397 RepID=UPI0039E8E2F6